ncbi:PH domain-containing protein [Microbacterium sp. 18062]|uniref:PH domain-containing protein n=1 Tax=Microbacterium sp. 18062 TaxID=2681410 RepID=UPI001F2FA647|nr:PH domain-containing protein [Microbacterium sp. 18062]
MSDTTPSRMQLRPPKLRIERRAIWLFVLRGVLRGGALLVALIVTYAIWEPARVWLIAPIVAVAIVLLAKAAVEPFWRYRVHRWEVTDRATYATTGWLVREWRVSPTSRIQTVDATRGPLEQLLGLSTLRVTTASSHGAVAVVGLDARAAEEAATRLALIAELTEGDAT